jgi:hypothetical protein
MTTKKQKMFTDVYRSFDNTSKEYTTTTLISGTGKQSHSTISSETPIP